MQLCDGKLEGYVGLGASGSGEGNISNDKARWDEPDYGR